MNFGGVDIFLMNTRSCCIFKTKFLSLLKRSIMTIGKYKTSYVDFARCLFTNVFESETTPPPPPPQPVVSSHLEGISKGCSPPNSMFSARRSRCTQLWYSIIPHACHGHRYWLSPAPLSGTWKKGRRE